MTAPRHSHRVMQAKPFTGTVRVRIRPQGQGWAWVEAHDGNQQFSIEEARVLMTHYEDQRVEVELHPVPEP